MADPHVLIIGAGIVGLLIAHGLQKAGIRYTIFEAEAQGQLRTKEWTIGIHWSLPMLTALLPPDIAARMDADGSVDPSLDWTTPPANGPCIYDGVNGKLLKDITPESRNVRVSRQRLRRLFGEGLAIHWSHTLETISCNEHEGTVTASFNNGVSYTGSLLVGADGPRSSVRNFLFAHDTQLAQVRNLDGIVGHSMVVSYDAATARFVRSAHPVSCLSISPHLFVFRSIQEVPDPDKPESWRFFLFASWLGDRHVSLNAAERLKALKDRGSCLAEPFRSAILSIPNNTKMPYIDVSYWIAEPWDSRNGLVTLAGDSAHPMPPYRAQGGNHAIQDAYNFVEAVRKLAQASHREKATMQASLVQEYGDEAAKKGAEETQLSIKNGYMCMAYSEFIESPYMTQGLSRGGS